MALQWAILGYVAAEEAVIAILLTLPVPRLVKSRIVALITLFLQPATGVIHFAGFQLLDMSWKNEHRLMCTSEVCTSEEMIRYEKSIRLESIISKGLINTLACKAHNTLAWGSIRNSSRSRMSRWSRTSTYACE